MSKSKGQQGRNLEVPKSYACFVTERAVLVLMGVGTYRRDYPYRSLLKSDIQTCWTTYKFCECTGNAPSTFVCFKFNTCNNNAQVRFGTSSMPWWKKIIRESDSHWQQIDRLRVRYHMSLSVCHLVSIKSPQSLLTVAYCVDQCASVLH
jgi:hypothetical protein